MIRSTVKCIDWKWIGVSYIIAIIIFGLAALIKWDFIFFHSLLYLDVLIYWR
jgi:hypothetical protein